MNLEKEFVPHQESLELKELGFDEPCFTYYHDGFLEFCLDGHNNVYERKNSSFMRSVSAPTFSQAFRWFREKYNLRGFIGFRPNTKQFDYHIYDMSLSGMEYVKQRTMEEFNKDPLVGTYEESELACLKKLIEIVKDGNKGR